MSKIVVDNTSITVLRFKESDFISLTDIAKRKSDEPSAVIGNWIRNRNTIDIWEYGKPSIIRILNSSNSRGLEKRMG